MSCFLCGVGFWGVGGVLAIVVFVHGFSPGVAVKYVAVGRFLRYLFVCFSGCVWRYDRIIHVCEITGIDDGGVFVFVPVPYVLRISLYFFPVGLLLGDEAELVEVFGFQGICLNGGLGCDIFIDEWLHLDGKLGRLFVDRLHEVSEHFHVLVDGAAVFQFFNS